MRNKIIIVLIFLVVGYYVIGWREKNKHREISSVQKKILNELDQEVGLKNSKYNFDINCRFNYEVYSEEYERFHTWTIKFKQVDEVTIDDEGILKFQCFVYQNDKFGGITMSYFLPDEYNTSRHDSVSLRKESFDLIKIDNIDHRKSIVELFKQLQVSCNQ